MKTPSMKNLDNSVIACSLTTAEVTLTLGDGSVVTGLTLEEAFENVTKAKAQQNTLPVPQPRRNRSPKFDQAGNRL